VLTLFSPAGIAESTHTDFGPLEILYMQEKATDLRKISLHLSENNLFDMPLFIKFNVAVAFILAGRFCRILNLRFGHQKVAQDKNGLS